MEKRYMVESGDKRFFKMYKDDTSGATAVEYGVIIALIAMACVTSLIQLGSSMNDTYKTLSDHLGGMYTPLGNTVVPPSGASSSPPAPSGASANNCSGVCAAGIPTTGPPGGAF